MDYTKMGEEMATYAAFERTYKIEVTEKNTSKN